MYVQEVATDDTLVRMCFHFSALIEDFAEIEVVEINPLMVFDSSRGCAAVAAHILFGQG